MTKSITTAPGPKQHLLMAAFDMLMWAASPVAQCAVFGGIAMLLAIHTPMPLAAACWFATAASIMSILQLVSTRQEPVDMTLPTNTSSIVLGLVQTIVLITLSHLYAPGSTFAKVGVAVFAVLNALDAADRVLFVLRMRRIGGVASEARRIADAIVRDHPEDAHGLIAEENVRRRNRSRLHWKLGEALSAENVALYECESLARIVDAAATTGDETTLEDVTHLSDEDFGRRMQR